MGNDNRRNAARAAAVIITALFAGVCEGSPPPPRAAQNAAQETHETTFAALQVKAQAGDATAQYKLGGLYYSGQGVPKDVVKAAEWWQKAAAQGEASSQSAVGWLYFHGEGVTDDHVLAYAWLNLAASQGCEGVAEARETVRRFLSKSQLAEAQRLSSAWKPGNSIVRENDRASVVQPPTQGEAMPTVSARTSCEGAQPRERYEPAQPRERYGLAKPRERHDRVRTDSAPAPIVATPSAAKTGDVEARITKLERQRRQDRISREIDDARLTSDMRIERFNQQTRDANREMDNAMERFHRDVYGTR